MAAPMAPPTINAKRRMDNLPQMGGSNPWHDTAPFRMVGKLFQAGDHLFDQSLTYVRNLLVSVPRANILKILDRRNGKGDPV